MKPIKIAVILDGVVQDVMTVRPDTAAILLSEPNFEFVKDNGGGDVS